MLKLPNSLRQFTLLHFFWVTLSICVPLGLAFRMPRVGIPLASATAMFWVGFAVLFLADVLDDRPIDERIWSSQVLSTLGALTIWFSILGGCVYLLWTLLIFGLG